MVMGFTLSELDSERSDPQGLSTEEADKMRQTWGVQTSPQARIVSLQIGEFSLMGPTSGNRLKSLSNS